MTCAKCGGNVEETFNTDVFDSGDRLVVIRKIPCFKCNDCGEIFYSIDVLQKVEEILETAKASPNEISILKFAA